jgi:hypothetical protein
MKITENLRIIPEFLEKYKLITVEDNKGIRLAFLSGKESILFDQEHGEGFTERTVAKLDAYFEVKEKMFKRSLELLDKQLENKQEN